MPHFRYALFAFATHTCFTIMLATKANSLLRVTKRISWSCKLLLVYTTCVVFLCKSTFQTMNDYNQQVSRSFHLRLRILFSFQLPYFFAIRLLRYLELAVDTTIFLLHIRGIVIFSWINFLVYLYLTITDYGMLFQATSSQPVKLYQAPHLNCISTAIRFALFRFRSPLLTESHLLSLPPLT